VLSPSADHAVRACLWWSRVTWGLTLAMPVGLHCIWPWAYRYGLERARTNPEWWGWREPRPTQWTAWFIVVFALVAIGVPRAMEQRWQERAPRIVVAIDPFRGGYRSAPLLRWDEASVERAVRWACRVFATRIAWALGVFNALSAMSWWVFTGWRCGGHWGCRFPPPSNYVPLLVAGTVLTLACFPTRARVLRVLPGYAELMGTRRWSP
jgi:hypothetical protein